MNKLQNKCIHVRTKKKNLILKQYYSLIFLEI